MVLECPNLEKVCRLILLFVDNSDYLQNGAFGLRGIFGEPTEHMQARDFHRWGYTKTTLSQLIEQGGFTKYVLADGISHLYPLRDMRVEAFK